MARETSPRQRPLLLEIALAGMATSGACVFSNPMEVVKTRMQMQGELEARSASAPKPYRNALHCFYRVAKEEGLRGIQAGLSVGIVYQIAMNGTRLGLFKPVCSVYGVGAAGDSEAMRFFKTLGAGATTGAIGGFVGSPIFLVKARLQNQGNKAAKFSYGYNGPIDAVKQIFKQEGLKGFFRGVEGAVPRVVVGSASQLSSYATCKRAVVATGLFKEEDVSTHFASSLVAGLIVTTAMNPFDVVSTRLYSQEVGKKSIYRSGIMGPVDCFGKILKTEGFFGLYKGWTAHYLRLGPHTVLTFMLWEQIKAFADEKGI